MPSLPSAAESITLKPEPHTSCGVYGFDEPPQLREVTVWFGYPNVVPLKTAR
ncbi:hypothetical protein GCM10020001_041970 [Nonomuraea salmonea]